MLTSGGLYNLLGIVILTAHFVSSGSMNDTTPLSADSTTVHPVSSSSQNAKEPNSPVYNPDKHPTLGRYPPRKGASPTLSDAEATTPTPTEDNLKPVKGTSSDGPDGQAVQRAFLVLAGLGTIIIAYFAIKFACVKRRRRERNPDPGYGLVETSEMDLLDGEDEDDDAEEDDTLFDLHSHRRT